LCTGYHTGQVAAEFISIQVTNNVKREDEFVIDFSVINFEFAIRLFLLLFIGMGPVLALVPFLQKTKPFDAETQCAIGRRMVLIAVVTALILFALGAILLRLLHISGAAAVVAGGIVLAYLGIVMATKRSAKSVEEFPVKEDAATLAVYPLAVPHLLNPVGITVLIVASDEVTSIAGAGLVVALVLLVAALDYFVFANIDKFSKRLNPSFMIVSEVVLGFLLTAIAVQMTVIGLTSLGIIGSA
jgi:small neutral amino acid transporter SnatA (MarC family)